MRVRVCLSVSVSVYVCVCVVCVPVWCVVGCVDLRSFVHSREADASLSPRLIPDAAHSHLRFTPVLPHLPCTPPIHNDDLGGGDGIFDYSAVVAPLAVLFVCGFVSWVCSCRV